MENKNSAYIPISKIREFAGLKSFSDNEENCLEYISSGKIIRGFTDLPDFRFEETYKFSSFLVKEGIIVEEKNIAPRELSPRGAKLLIDNVIGDISCH